MSNHLHTLLSELNTKPIDFVLKHIASTKQNGYFEYKPMYVSKLPILYDKKQSAAIAAQVQTLLELQRELESAPNSGAGVHARAYCKPHGCANARAEVRYVSDGRVKSGY